MQGRPERPRITTPLESGRNLSGILGEPERRDNMNKRHGKRRVNVQWLTGTALMIALTLVLGSTPLGRINLPFLTATTMHIPVIIATLVLGLGSGMLVGLTFGLHSLISNLTNASFFAPFFINPLVSVLPRVLFPIAVYLIAKGVGKLTEKFDKNHIIAYVAASGLGTAVHTTLVMGMIYLLYSDRILEMLTTGAQVPDAIARGGVGMGIAIMGVTNGVPEAIVAVVIAPVIVIALNKALRYIRVQK